MGDTRAENGDAVLCESRGRECAHSLGIYVVAGGREEGRAETGAEGEGVREFYGMRFGVGGGGEGLGFADRRDILRELVAGELGVGHERGEHINEVGPVAQDCDDRLREYGGSTHSSPLKNSVVRARYSLDKLDESTPP